MKVGGVELEVAWSLNRPLSGSKYRFKYLENSFLLLSVSYDGKINLELCQL